MQHVMKEIDLLIVVYYIGRLLCSQMSSCCWPCRVGLLAYRWRRLVVLSVTLIQIDASAVCVAYRDRQNREFGGSLIIEAAQLIRLAAKTLDSPINFYGAVYVLWRSLSLLLCIRSISLSLYLLFILSRNQSKLSWPGAVNPAPSWTPVSRAFPNERTGWNSPVCAIQTDTHTPSKAPLFSSLLSYSLPPPPHRSGLCLWWYIHIH